MTPTPIVLAIEASNLVSELGATDDEPPSLWLVGAAGCLCIAILGSVTSTALLLYSPTKLARALSGDSRPRLTELNQHRTAYHALARSLAIGGTIGAGLLMWEGSSAAMRPWAMAVFSMVAIVGCGVLPGAIASSRAERVVMSTHRPLELLRRIFYYPIVVPLVTAANQVLRLLRIHRHKDNPDSVVEDIIAAVEDSASDSGLAADERSWIENIVDLKDMLAREIMTPRTDAVAFDKNMPLLDATAEATRAGYSRFPVYDGRVDHVVGVFYAKDVLPLLGESQTSCEAKVSAYMRKPLFVPEAIGLVDLLRQFRTSRVQMAIVLDEYGGTAGLVTIEDVLEEIVGDITDEYDPDEHPRIDVIEVGRVIETSGRVRIEEINDALDVGIPENDSFDTVAGFLFAALDRIPKVGETVEIEGVEFEVLEADDRRIHRLRLSLPAARVKA